MQASAVPSAEPLSLQHTLCSVLTLLVLVPFLLGSQHLMSIATARVRHISDTSLARQVRILHYTPDVVFSKIQGTAAGHAEHGGLCCAVLDHVWMSNE